MLHPSIKRIHGSVFFRIYVISMDLTRFLCLSLELNTGY